jgi:hypothetical protein
LTSTALQSLLFANEVEIESDLNEKAFFVLFQVEMTGSSIFNYVHQSDHAEIAEQLGLCLADGQTSPPPTDEPTGSNNPDGELSFEFALLRLSSWDYSINFFPSADN